METNRIAAAALAAFGAASALPLALAQLDFAGVVDAFGVDSDDARSGLLVLAGVSGALTFVVLAVAFVGAALALAGHRSARLVLAVAAVAGFATATILWIPAGITIGGAAVLLGRPGALNPAD